MNLNNAMIDYFFRRYGEDEGFTKATRWILESLDFGIISPDEAVEAAGYLLRK